MQFSWQGGQDEGLEEELEGMSEVEVWKERPHGNISFTLSTFDSAEKKNFAVDGDVSAAAADTRIFAAQFVDCQWAKL